MQRGNLVIYDVTGKIFAQTGESEGDVVPHEYPVGIPYIEIPYGTMATKKLISINVSNPDNHVPIFEDIEIPLSYNELEAQNAQMILALVEGGLM